MIITRWLAEMKPSLQNVKMLFAAEGLESFTEEFQPQQKVNEHKHPFCEVRLIVAGEMLFNVSGNQFLLREGDRVEVPANTRHSHTAQGNQPCICVVAQKIV